jgi:diaminopimelate decarboxylase
MLFLQKRGLQDPFYVLDLGLLIELYQGWVQSIPRVKPFYAVKCSPDPALLSTLAALGAGFDCASKAEISQVLALGVSPEKIIFANPCKMHSHIKYAASVGVNIMTFDCEMEVHCSLPPHRKQNEEKGVTNRVSSTSIAFTLQLGLMSILQLGNYAVYCYFD